jgi:hypothetical protein
MRSKSRGLAALVSIVCIALAPIGAIAGCSAAQQKAAVVAGLDTVECVLSRQGQGLTAVQLAEQCGLAEVGDVIRIVTAARRAAPALLHEDPLTAPADGGKG